MPDSRHRFPAAFVLFSIMSGCASVPEDPSKGELIASNEVQRIVMEGLDGSDIRCRRERRTGTHMITRTCMTLDEWREKSAHSRDEVVDHLAFPPCANPNPGIGKPYGCAPIAYGSPARRQ